MNIWLKISQSVSIGIALMTFGAVSTPASALVFGPSGVCPTSVVNATDCNLFITFNANGTVATTSGPQSTYDGAEDALIGVINNSGHTINSFVLNGGALDIFGFDGDGIDTLATGGPIVPVAGNPDLTGYGGLDAFYTNIVGNIGTVNFVGGIPTGGHDFFSLEEQASLNIGVTSGVPEPSALSLFAAGLASLGAIRRRRKVKQPKIDGRQS